MTNHGTTDEHPFTVRLTARNWLYIVAIIAGSVSAAFGAGAAYVNRIERKIDTAQQTAEEARAIAKAAQDDNKAMRIELSSWMAQIAGTIGRVEGQLINLNRKP